MASQRRLTLFQTLSALPAPQFELLRFTLNPPPGIVPEGMAAQGNRVAALLSWVEGATGCGLERLCEVVEQLCPGCLGDRGDGGDEEGGGELPWMVPYGRNPYFTGRDEVLTTLYQQLHDRQTAAISQTQAISGLGGIGKIQTAVEYAYRYRDDYRYVFWVGADTELELTSGYVSIAQRLNLPLKDAENQDETVQSVRLWLSREEGWLLIFDNGDRPELVQPFLPREIKGHILVTSRAQDFQDLGIVQPISMETLNPEEAIAFLLTRTARTHPVGAHPRVRPTQEIKPITNLPIELGQSDRINPADGPNPTVTNLGQSRGIAPTEYTAATDLAAELGYLPLALEQAAAYIVTNRVSFTDYLKSYRKQRLKRLEKAKPKLGRYPDSVATTWALNLKEVQKAAPAAAALLNYCAFLHADTIPFNLFTQGAAELGEPLATALADAADDPLDLYDLLNPLCGYSLVRVEPESQSFSLHRLVQEVIRAELGDDGCQNWVEPLFEAMAQLTPGKDEYFDYRKWPALAPLVNHVQELASHCQQRGITSITAADTFHVVGRYLLDRGQCTLAKPLLQRALKLRKSLLDSEHEDIAASLDRVAEAYAFQGNHSDAQSFFQEALAMRKRLFGEEDLRTANSFNNIAELYRKKAEHSASEQLHKKALSIRKRLHTSLHTDISESLNNLALLYTEISRLDEAEPLYTEAIEIDKSICGEDSQELATDYHNLAILMAEKGDFNAAKRLCKKALNKRQLHLGKKHPLVADSINVLGTICENLEQLEQAEMMYRDVLELDKELFGEEHYKVAESLNNLGLLLIKQANFIEAEKLLKEALDMRKITLGDNDFRVTIALNNLAYLYCSQSHYNDAKTFYQEAADLHRQLLDAKHPKLATSLNNLARCYRETADYDRAEELCQEALAIAQVALPADHELKGRFLDDFATLRAAQGRTEEARSLYQQALAILEPKRGGEHPWTVRCRENLTKLENGE